ncbi:MAG: DNA polymerase III subunit delta' [Campylobacterales bacterium]|nr:DNA polymerase III subunit delta' [Campylobacterales bacterium]
MSNTLPRSHICITDEIEAYSAQIASEVQGHRVVHYLRDDFLIEDARAVIAEAYISEEREKFLVLGAKSFNVVSQNALLKILEEPPRNIVFVLITQQKSALLPTIRSRLSMKKLTQGSQYVPLELSLSTLELSSLFEFVKANERLGRHELHSLLERLYRQAVFVESMTLSKEQLEAFDLAYRLVRLNARAQTLLLALLATFLKPVPKGGPRHVR